MKGKFLVGAIAAMALSAGFPASGAAIDENNITVTSDTGATPKDGTHTVQVLVDSADTVAGSSESNNGGSLTLRPKGGRIVK